MSYDPVFAAAFAPIATAMSQAPKMAVGDVNGRRRAMGALFGLLLNSMPSIPSVTVKQYQTTSCDGNEVTIHHFSKTTDTQTDASGKQNEAGPAVLHIHGGGLILGSVDDFNRPLSAQVEATGVPIFSVEYRLAPEHPYPAAHNDAVAGLKWLHEHAHEFNVSPQRIGVMGESAGGNLATGLALKAKDEKIGSPIKKLILVYPMLDDRNTEPIKDLNGLEVWTTADNATGWGAYLSGSGTGGPGEKDVSKYAAPARAEIEDLKAMPETYVDVGGVDIFRDEDLAFVSKLGHAGVRTEFHLYPGVPHGFEAFSADLDVTKRAWANRYAAVRSL